MRKYKTGLLQKFFRSKENSVLSQCWIINIVTRGILTFSIAFVMMFAILAPIPIYALDTMEVAYTAYYDFLQTRLDQVGYYQPSTIWATPISELEHNGVIYSRLVDFDNDGISDLFVLESKKVVVEGTDIFSGTYQRAVWQVFSCRNGVMLEIANGELPVLPPMQFGFSLDSNNKAYFVYLYDEGHRSLQFSTILDGNWQTTDFFSYPVPDWRVSGYVNGEHFSVASGSGHYDSGTINGETVEYSEFMKQRDFFWANSIDMFNMKGYDFLGLKSIPDDVPQAVIMELEKHIPGDYVARYRTPSDWAALSVNKAIANGIVPADLQKKYTTPITRGEFCALAVSFYEKTTGKVITTGNSFNDTNDINIQKIAGFGIVSGVGDGNFAPEQLLTREQAAVILTNFAKILDSPLDDGAATFDDNGDISSWAINHVGEIQKSGIMGGVGDNKFAPKSPYTREQSIITIMKMNSSSIQVENIEIIEHVEVAIAGTASVPSAHVMPNNASNKNLTWESSDTKIFTVNSATGQIKGVSEGKAELIGKSNNGVTVQTTVTVLPSFSIKLPQAVNFLATKYMGISNIDDIPESSTVAGEITINSMTLDRLSYGELKIEATVTEENMDISQFNPYLKWAIKDASGTIVDSGVIFPSSIPPTRDNYAIYFYPLELGTPIKIRILTKNTHEGNAYTLEFINDVGN